MTDSRLQALVLRRTNYGEADRIIQVITPEGKRSLMAKGVRKEKSKLAGGIELFCLSDITVHSGRGDLGVLTSARLVKFYDGILQDYDGLKFAYEAIKVVGRSSEHAESPEFFSILNDTLEGLNVGAPLDLVRAWFYLRHAKVMGEELNLATDADGQKLRADGKYMYDTEDQALREANGGDITADHIKLLRVMTHNDLKTVLRIADIDQLAPGCLHLAQIIAKL